MIAKWYELAGIDGDIAVSTRVRLARNFNNIPFPNRMTDDQAQQVLDKVSEKMLGSAGGIEFRLVDMMVTNFHQPESTLILLISAFVGGDWKTIYDFALSNGFRFLSYGDSSLLFKHE